MPVTRMLGAVRLRAVLFGAVLHGAMLFGAVAPAGVCAQGSLLAPVNPHTTAGASLEGSFETGEAVDAVHAGLLYRGAVSPTPELEIGAAWGARLSGVFLDGGAGRVRVGLPPLRFWVGTGAELEGVRLGLRLEGGAGPQLVDGPEISSGGEWALARLEAAVGWTGDWIDARVSVRAGAAYSGASAWAGVGTLHVSVSFGGEHVRARPYLEGIFHVATDLGYAARTGGGLLAAFAEHRLRLGFTIGYPDDPTGLLVRVQLGWQIDLDPPAAAPGSNAPQSNASPAPSTE
ncbi:MAG TPA: hypothetical protein ENK57_18710 [Polyangiaceae bacterium]|nr:hypothetical protein [Polyangiaceae bacterium]